MNKILSLLPVLLLLFLLPVHAQTADVELKTYLYAVKGADSLYLDKYELRDRIDGGEPRPCVIFMFGGGFVGGERYSDYYVPYFDFLLENGYKVVSIDYRLGLKPVATGELRPGEGMGRIKQAKEFLKVFRGAIDMAVEDLFDATSFVLENADDWGIDQTKIIANGSSAGAISVLHGEYAICNGDGVTSRLPAGFNYAGVVSFAGALFVEARDITFRSIPCPVMLFHGDADSNVPYDKIKKLGMGFYGSKYISKKLSRINAPHIFYSVENADHRIAGSPMHDNRHDVMSFLEKFVAKGERLMIGTDVQQIGVPDRKKKFRIGDYVKANFGG